MILTKALRGSKRTRCFPKHRMSPYQEGIINHVQRKGGEKMKNRKRQRINRRMKEEMLNPVNEYGIGDPTPYLAMRNIIKESNVHRSDQNKAK